MKNEEDTLRADASKAHGRADQIHRLRGLLARTRVQASLPLLRAGRMRVYEVAEAAGFTDYKSFCQAFKKYLHESPRAWLSREGETHETL